MLHQLRHRAHQDMVLFWAAARVLAPDDWYIILRNWSHQQSTTSKNKEKLGKLDKPQGTELRSAPRAFCFDKLQGSRQVLVVYKLY